MSTRPSNMPTTSWLRQRVAKQVRDAAAASMV